MPPKDTNPSSLCFVSNKEWNGNPDTSWEEMGVLKEAAEHQLGRDECWNHRSCTIYESYML